ncbi:F-box protein At3g07870-like [Papaver somniferum]|uniref:F-box protein At3g07870-like n=1 Tax=Papaver somniferum TaxID=3469 RepID=UPI000E6F84B8|nr:F-box protein At3g07870-like [Papaver somniferum]
MEYFNLLPEEITLDIISRVPAESVLECKLVCTNWRCLVGHPSFSKMHLDHLNHPATDSGELNFIAFTSSDWWTNYNFRYFEYDENHESIERMRIRRLNVKIPFGWGTIFVGSCNGLICCYSSAYIWICNPINREYILLPEINRVGMYYRGNGFDYVSSTNEYKVVTIIFEKETEFTEFMEVHVYTLGSGKGWKNLGKFNLGTRDIWEEVSV